MTNINKVAKLLRPRVSFFFSFVCLHLIPILFFSQSLSGQSYFGVGLHLTPPVYLEYTKNSYVVARPKVGVAGSFTLKKEWNATKNKKWYTEVGLTTQSLVYHQTNYYGDTVSIWGDYENRHVGFPSILFGLGASTPIFKSRGQLSMGLEGTALITQDLGGIGSASYEIVNDPSKHQIFPLFLRLNIGYRHDIQLSKNTEGHLQLYASLSPQKITKGAQYIRSLPDGGPTLEGTYHLNNSELGLKLFVGLNTERIKPSHKTDNTPTLELQSKKTKYRISLTGQLYRPSPAIYYIPQVDSFSIKSRNLIFPSQIGLSLEFPFRRNKLWSSIFGIGVGQRAAVFIFKANSNFSPDGTAIGFESEIPGLGYYAICNIGIAKRHLLHHKVISHGLTWSMVIPVTKEDVYFGVPLGPRNQFPPYPNAIMEGTVSTKYGRNKVLMGIEYNPELFFNQQSAYFVAVGLIFNHSFGTISHGRFQVKNNTTTYYGGVVQHFSKIGITLRCGLER